MQTLRLLQEPLKTQIIIEKLKEKYIVHNCQKCKCGKWTYTLDIYPQLDYFFLNLNKQHL